MIFSFYLTYSSDKDLFGLLKNVIHWRSSNLIAISLLPHRQPRALLHHTVPKHPSRHLLPYGLPTFDLFKIFPNYNR